MRSQALPSSSAHAPGIARNPVRRVADYLSRVETGSEARRLATRLDLQLLDYLDVLRCCICCNFVHNQLQPLVEPQPSQT